MARNRDPFHDGLLWELGRVWEAHGGIYGQSHFDPVHFQGAPIPVLRV